MSTTIDSLDIQIQTSAKQANSSLDGLARRLKSISTALGGFNALGGLSASSTLKMLTKSVQGLSNVDSSSVTKVARSITNVSKIDTSNLSKKALDINGFVDSINGIGGVSDDSLKIVTLANGISKLGSKSVTTAITNMPALADGLKKVMTTLSTAPQVSENLIQMTNALANISRSGSGFQRVANSMVNGLGTFNTSAKRTTKTTMSLAAAFGRFYANCWLLVRGLKALWKSIEGTTDYIEAYNYFDVSFGKIASEWQHEYGKFGYDNAEAYAKSFTTRMNNILGRMSGVSLEIGEDGTGLLTETGVKSLGMNIREMTQAASNIASITNSVGQTGEVSLAAAQSLTALAGDISSLFNVDYSSAMTNLKSGLIGQSRALYKYGIDITNATLQTYAYEHGITKAVSEMSQAEKMQLRLLAILDQSKVAWGDLANTINSPSNMIRQFKNNISELGTVIGQLFIPILSKVLPFINGVTIALKRLMSAIAGFFGIRIKLDDYGSGYNDDTLDGLEDVAAGYDGATAAAKKYQKTILGFDQLNKLNDNESSSGGGASGGGGGFDLTGDIMDAADGYLSVWNEAYQTMENKAIEFADKITSALFPVRLLLADIAHGNWEMAGESLTLVLTSIFDFMSNAIDSVDWYQLGYNIGQFLAGIDWISIMSSVGEAIWEAVKAAIELGAGLFSTAPIETTIMLAFALIDWSWLKTTLMTTLGPKLGEALALTVGGAAVSLNEAMVAVLGPVVTILLGIGTAISGVIIWAKAFFEMWEEGFSWANEILMLFGIALGAVGAIILGAPALVTGVIAGIVAAVSTAVILIRDNWDSICSFFEKSIKEVSEFFNRLGQSISQYLSQAWDNIKMKWANTKDWFSSNIIQPLSNLWSNFTDWLGKTVENVWNWILNLFSNGGQIFSGVVEGVAGVFKTIVNAIIRGINKVIASPFRTVNSVLNKIRSISVLGIKPFSGLWGYNPLPVPQIPTFTTGGFPEDGLFMANHGELVGQFSNGKTAVANNKQITDGIAKAVYPAVYNAVRSAMSETSGSGSQMIDNRIYIGEEEVARAVTRGQQKLNRRYQVSTT